MGQVLDHDAQGEAALKRVEERSSQEVDTSPDPFVPQAAALLDTIPGVAETVAQMIIAEIGVEMSCCPTDNPLASWAGLCPGNNASAGKRKSGQTTKGSRYLRAALGQAAGAASPQQGTYLAAQ